MIIKAIKFFSGWDAITHRRDDGYNLLIEEEDGLFLFYMRTDRTENDDEDNAAGDRYSRWEIKEEDDPILEIMRDAKPVNITLDDDTNSDTIHRTIIEFLEHAPEDFWKPEDARIIAYSRWLPWNIRMNIINRYYPGVDDIINLVKRLKPHNEEDFWKKAKRLIRMLTAITDTTYGMTWHIFGYWNIYYDYRGVYIHTPFWKLLVSPGEKVVEVIYRFLWEEDEREEEIPYK